MPDIFDRLTGAAPAWPTPPAPSQATDQSQPPPTPPPAPPPADQSQAPGGTIFDRLAAQNPLTLNLPAAGPPKTQQQYEQGFQDVANTAAKYAPGTLAAIGGMLAPEVGIPMLLYTGAGALAGSGIEQGTQLATGSPEAPQSAGEAALRAGQDVGEQELAELGGRGVAKGVGWGLGKLTPYARRLYQTALRPPVSMGAEEAAKLTETALREGIEPSAKGYSLARGRIDALNQEIADKIATKSKQLGEVIEPEHIAQELEAMRPWAKTQALPEADVSALDAAKAQFLRQHTVQAPYTKIVPYLDPAEAQVMGSPFYPAGQGTTPVVQPMTLAQAQALKSGTYGRLAGAYGEIGSAQREYAKALARGLRQDIVAAYPELAKLNARDSALIDLADELEKHAVRMTQGGAGVSLTPAAIGAAAGHPAAGLAVGTLRSLYRNPVFRGKLAIALYRAATSQLPGRAITAGMHELAPDQPIRINPNPSAALPPNFNKGGPVANEEVDRLARGIDRGAILRSLQKGHPKPVQAAISR